MRLTAPQTAAKQTSRQPISQPCRNPSTHRLSPQQTPAGKPCRASEHPGLHPARIGTLQPMQEGQKLLPGDEAQHASLDLADDWQLRQSQVLESQAQPSCSPSLCTGSPDSSIASDVLAGMLTCLNISSPPSTTQRSLVPHPSGPFPPPTDRSPPPNSASPAFATPASSLDDAGPSSSPRPSRDPNVKRLSFQTACSAASPASSTACDSPASPSQSRNSSPAVDAAQPEHDSQTNLAADLQLAAALPLPDCSQTAPSTPTSASVVGLQRQDAWPVEADSGAHSQAAQYPSIPWQQVSPASPAESDESSSSVAPHTAARHHCHAIVDTDSDTGASPVVQLQEHAHHEVPQPGSCQHAMPLSLTQHMARLAITSRDTPSPVSTATPAVSIDSLAPSSHDRQPSCSPSDDASPLQYGYSTHRRRQRLVVSDDESPYGTGLPGMFGQLSLASKAATSRCPAGPCMAFPEGHEGSLDACSSLPSEAAEAVSTSRLAQHDALAGLSSSSRQETSATEMSAAAGVEHGLTGSLSSAGRASATDDADALSSPASCSPTVAPTTVRRRLQGRFRFDSDSDDAEAPTPSHSSRSSQLQAQQPLAGQAAYRKRLASPRSSSIRSGQASRRSVSRLSPLSASSGVQPTGQASSKPRQRSSPRQPSADGTRGGTPRRLQWMDAALEYSKQADCGPSGSSRSPADEPQAPQERTSASGNLSAGHSGGDSSAQSPAARQLDAGSGPTQAAAKGQAGSQAAFASDRDHNRSFLVVPKPMTPKPWSSPLRTLWPWTPTGNSLPRSPPTSQQRNPSNTVRRSPGDAVERMLDRELLEHCIAADAVEPPQAQPLNSAGPAESDADSIIVVSDSSSEDDVRAGGAPRSVHTVRPNRSVWDDLSDDNDDFATMGKENTTALANLLLTPVVPKTAIRQPRPPATPVVQTPATTPGKGRRRAAGTGAEPSQPLTAAAFKRQRIALAYTMYQKFNATVFDGRLPADLQITWSPHYKTTAGMTHYIRTPPSDPFGAFQYSAQVELSSKVLDCADKLERTLAHELCHVAAWLLDHVHKPPHGAVFKRWAAAIMAVYPQLDITTCHSYEIHAPWQWRCTGAECGRVFKRHSKSIDEGTQVCGFCKSKLVFVGKLNADGTPSRHRAPNQYSLFVKEHFAAAQKACPAGTPAKEVMKKLATQWKARDPA